MRNRLSISMLTLAGMAAAAAIAASITLTSAQAPLLKTPWGDPDFQGIWTNETSTPLQRPNRFANQEFFTDAQRAELDRARAGGLGRDRRDARGSEVDVAGAYNVEFNSYKRTGKRTSLVVDPPNGRIPPLTPEADKAVGADRDFRLALLQATEACKSKSAACNGWQYNPTPSPRLNERAPRYNTQRINRHDGPEDGALADRCLTIGIPDFAGVSYRRIVQTPGGISIFYDVGQGQGWQRNIIMDGRPHLPASIRQWYGDSRGRWDGTTLVIDVTNFSPKNDFRGSRENLHVVERWTRTSPTTLDYAVTVEDPTVWTRPWTAKIEYTRQNEEQNRIYYEPRCVEGNYGHAGLLKGQRVDDLAFAEGRGPHPATKDNATGFMEDDGFN
jgi:hypothetical protein